MPSRQDRFPLLPRERADVDADWRARLATAPPMIQALAVSLEEVA